MWRIYERRSPKDNCSTDVDTPWIEFVDSLDNGDNRSNLARCPQKGHMLFHRLFSLQSSFFSFIPTEHRAY
jgi:hypothetical protein